MPIDYEAGGGEKMEDNQHVTRRDIFAAHIMGSLCIGQENKTGAELTLACRAYKYANNMMQARLISLFQAITSGYLEPLKDILETEPQLINTKIPEFGEEGKTSLLLAKACQYSSSSHLEIIDYLLSLGADIELIDITKLKPEIKQHLEQWKNKQQTA
jgi:hypothetical protein